jgi:DNA polymerase III alpha subunit (gram-positive type)
MRYISIDFEYNQAFDFKRNSKGRAKKECPFEIIQIGAVKLNENFEIIDRFNYLIKPKIYKKIHPIVEKMTDISLKSLKNEKGFEEVYDLFLDFLGDNFALCFWGSHDLKEMFRNAEYYKKDLSKLPEGFIDVQAIASKYLKFESGSAIGLENAVKALEITAGEKFHNAANDALYTARVLKKVAASLSG